MEQLKTVSVVKVGKRETSLYNAPTGPHLSDRTKWKYVCCWPEGLPFSSGLLKPNKLLPGHGHNSHDHYWCRGLQYSHQSREKSDMHHFMLFNWDPKIVQRQHEQGGTLTGIQTEEATCTGTVYCLVQKIKCKSCCSMFMQCDWCERGKQLQITYCLLLLQQNQAECL